MLDRIYRVTSAFAELHPQPADRGASLTVLPRGQAVARLDYSDRSGWWYVFADTPGRGVYVGYVRFDGLSLWGGEPEPAPIQAPPAAPPAAAPPLSDVEIDAAPRVSAFVQRLVDVCHREHEAMDKGLTKETAEEGLKRVEKYWREGVTWMTDAQIAAALEKRTAWSAAFISYVMRDAGADKKFLYSSGHRDYIRAAIRAANGRDTDAGFVGRRVDAYAPRVGDLACFYRETTDWIKDGGERITYDNALDERIAGHGNFPSHSDVVVSVDKSAGVITLIGGNVSHSVSATVRRIDDQGRIRPGQKDYFCIMENRL